MMAKFRLQLPRDDVFGLDRYSFQGIAPSLVVLSQDRMYELVDGGVEARASMQKQPNEYHFTAADLFLANNSSLLLSIIHGLNARRLLVCIEQRFKSL